MKCLLGIFIQFCLFAHAAEAQFSDTLAQQEASPLQVSGGIDVYYAYDFSRPIGRERLYTTQAAQHNEFNLNWGFIQTDYATDCVRGTLAIHTGTYVQVNYAAEPNELTRLISQANAGVKLIPKVWLDIGILPSHIGYESTFSYNNEVYTRALMAENSPYYETGAQLTVLVSDKITTKVLVLNGWQNINETNHAKSLGLGLDFSPTENLKLGYSNYYGNEAPDSLEAKRRFFHSVYVKYIFSSRLTVTASADYGRQELADTQKKGNWYAGMLVARYQPTKLFAVAGRVEHYNDKKQIIVVTGTPQGFQTSSASLNLDYIPAPGLLWRLEARGYTSKDKIFLHKELARRNNLLLVTSVTLKL